MKIRKLLIAAAIGIVGLFPIAAPAQATHSCGFDPCVHPDDVIEYLCYKFPVLNKYPGVCSY